MQNILNQLCKTLSAAPRFVKDGRLQKNKVMESAHNMDGALLQLLAGNEEIRECFFKQAGGCLVFDKVMFQQYVASAQFLPDSYTAYRNKIGLYSGGRYLHEVGEVVLAWPYKDCVLEGGQSRDSQTRREVFYNQVLAPEQIHRMLEPKVFRNFRRYTASGCSGAESIGPADNYIIKGNNLIALHSLMEMPWARGQVKCIFVDPPYNTENDTFNYNDSFSHSTWLTFMKNRVQAAMELLSDDGLFWTSLSDHEAHYYKVMMDEVFGRENFVADIIWNSTKSVTNTAVISGAHTHILLYAKNAALLKENRASFRLEARSDKFSNPDNDPRGKWVADPFQVGGERPNQMYTIVNPKTGVEYRPLPGNSWKNEKKVFDKLMADGRIVFGTTGDSGPQRKRFWYEAKERGEVPTTLWKDLPTTTNGTAHLKELFGDRVFSNPKPEGLIERILQLSTKEGDLVLDFCLGSGTTCTAAHKMHRRYIGIEQMDYIETIPLERLQKVMQGEQGGISKSCGWTGGGSLVYMELMDDAMELMDSIARADEAQLSRLFSQMANSTSISYNIDLHDPDAFHSLDIHERRQLLMDCVNKNHLYVALSDIDNGDYHVAPADRELTLKLYSNEHQLL